MQNNKSVYYIALFKDGLIPKMHLGRLPGSLAKINDSVT